MLEFKIVDAKEKDTDLLYSIKLVTMIDDEMDKVLTYEEKNKLRKNVLKSIETSYQDYKIIYVDKKIAGAYYVMPYESGYIIDEIYLFKEFRNQEIGTNIINKLKKDIHSLYVWVYKNNVDALRFFERNGFNKVQGGRTLILKYDAVYGNIKEKLNNIKLGYRDKEGNKYVGYGRDFKDIYYLQSPKQLLESKIGTCFDQVELERDIVSKLGVDLRTYFIFYPDDKVEASHTFLVYKDNKKYYWVENAWEKYKGLHIYNSKDKLISDVVSKFVKTIPKGDIKKVRLYLYDKPKYGINYVKFLSYCINSKLVRIK